MTTGDGPVLVTGGAGYIGSHAVLALRDAGRDVVVVDDLSSGRRALVPDGVPLVVGDVADGALMADVFGRYRPAAVLHFAGSIVVEESVREPMKYYRNNTEASRSLIESSVAAGIGTFIFSSTAAVYGNAARVPISEDSAQAPLNPYGRSKQMTETILSDVAAVSGMRYAILRYFNVAGADPDGRSGQCSEKATHLIKIACEAAVGKRASMSVYGTDYDTPDGTCVRDYVHVSDLADAHVVALDHLLAHDTNVVANVGYGHGYSVREVLDKFIALGNSGLVIHEAARRDGDAAALVADNTRIRGEIGWTPRYDDLATIIQTALAWERGLLTRPL